MSLNLVYSFSSGHNHAGEFKPARYKVIYFFSAEGFLEARVLSELAKSVPEADFQNLTFLSLDDLKAFAGRVGEEFSASDVRLVSVQDFNIGIDGAKDLAGFRSIFSKYGEALGPAEPQKRKGLLGKFFR